MSDCVFCKIVSGEIPSNKVYEDDDALAFEDINAKAPIHTLIIPKAHFATMNDVGAEQEGLLEHMMLVAIRVAADKGLRDKGYRLVANCGETAGQSVFHIHLHVMGGRDFSWPPG